MMGLLERTQNILHCAVLFSQGAVSNEKSFEEWFKICRYCHEKGFLYVGFGKNDKIDVAVIAYRVKRIEDAIGDTIPAKEEGNILYVQSCASISKDKLNLSRMMHWYLRNNRHIKEVAFHNRNNDSDLRRFKHGKIK